MSFVGARSHDTRRTSAPTCERSPQSTYPPQARLLGTANSAFISKECKLHLLHVRMSSLLELEGLAEQRLPDGLDAFNSL